MDRIVVSISLRRTKGHYKKKGGQVKFNDVAFGSSGYMVSLIPPSSALFRHRFQKTVKKKKKTSSLVNVSASSSNIERGKSALSSGKGTRQEVQ